MEDVPVKVRKYVKTLDDNVLTQNHDAVVTEIVAAVIDEDDDDGHHT